MPLILQRRDWQEALTEARRDLEIVGLGTRSELPPVKLSGGEQQRVAIARAIVGRPDILVLDEPTASLDGDTGRDIVKFIRDEILNESRCIIIVTHDARIFEFADRILEMADGRLTEIKENGRRRGAWNGQKPQPWHTHDRPLIQSRTAAHVDPQIGRNQAFVRDGLCWIAGGAGECLCLGPACSGSAARFQSRSQSLCPGHLCEWHRGKPSGSWQQHFDLSGSTWSGDPRLRV